MASEIENPKRIEALFNCPHCHYYEGEIQWVKWSRIQNITSRKCPKCGKDGLSIDYPAEDMNMKRRINHDN